jgi:hypothetical protein
MPARKLISAQLSPVAFARILISPAPGSRLRCRTSTILRISPHPPFHKAIFSGPPYRLFCRVRAEIESCLTQFFAPRMMYNIVAFSRPLFRQACRVPFCITVSPRPR